MIAALALLAGCAQSPPKREPDAYWLWAGVRPQPMLADARRIYLLYGEVTHRGGTLLAQRPATPRLKTPEVWMVVRVETLDWAPASYDRLAAALARWRAAGNRVAGLQIDFDAATHGLQGYARFLKALRARLPAELKLGVTGLLDWSANGDPKGLDALAGSVDEVVLQIYQGRRVIPGYERYLARLDRMKVPFRIGLVQGGEWQAPAGLEANPMFRGYVIFLLNR